MSGIKLYNVDLNGIRMRKNLGAIVSGKRLSDLQSHGPYNNVARLGLNGLTTNSFAASSIHTGIGGGAAAVFDGYTYDPLASTQGMLLHDGYPSTKNGRGYMHGEAGEVANQWYSVDFGEDVVIGSFQTFTFSNSTYPGQNPKNIQLQTSNDGLNWTTVFTGACDPKPDDGVTYGNMFTLPHVVSARHYRIFIIDNYGNPSFTSMGELELYSI